MILSLSSSLQPALEQLRDLARLAPDWDAQGSPPPSSLAVAEACRVLVAVYEQAPPAASEHVAPFHLAPIPGGGVLLEWRGAAADIEVEVSPAGTFGYLLTQRGQGDLPSYEEQDDVPWTELVALIGRVIAGSPLG